MKVFRKVGAQYLVVAESAFEDLVSGENVFSSRGSVEAGDVLGLYGSSSAPYCAADGPGDTLGAILTAGDLPVGTTHSVGGTGNYKAALFATIEPDSAGEIAEFKLSIPSKLKKALGKLPKKTKVKTTITVSGTGLLNTDAETISLTLRGRR